MIKTIIVDDEKNSRIVIRELVNEYFKDISILAEADSVKSAVSAINKYKPDLVFLDINLPDGTGFNVLELVENNKFKVVFITAHEEYAIKAIRFSAFDYILKPIEISKIIETLTRILAETAIHDNQLKLDAYNENFKKAEEIEKIVLTTANKIYVLEISEIIRCESDNNYTNFYLTSGKKIVVSKTIKTYDEILSGSGFIRIHQSHLINSMFISEFDKSEGGYLVMKNNDKLPVAVGKKAMLLDYFSSL